MFTTPIVFFSFLSLSSISLSSPDSEPLLTFKKSLSNTQGLESWVPNTLPCNKKTSLWEGIICNNGILMGIHLSNMSLSGKIDIDALSKLPTLRTISFINNSFSGPIPEFNRLTTLKGLLLSFNRFSGEIPSDFFSKMEMLKKVWLSANKFSGAIPNSLGKLTRLIELHLEENDFTGSIPDISQKTITSLDLSNNKLQGEIPPKMARFGVRSFQDNPGLCGKPINKECNKTDPIYESIQAKPSKSKTVWVILGIILLVIIISTFLRLKQNMEKLTRPLKGSFRNKSEACLPSKNPMSVDSMRLSQKSSLSQKNSMSQKSSMSRKSSLSQKSIRGKAETGDLVVVNDHKGFFGLGDLMKAAAEVLGNGGLGSAYKAVMGNGVTVVVKRMRGMNQMSQDTFDAEIRRLGRLNHQNILTPLAYHYRKEEKLLVSEFVPRGSLLFILHGDRGISHAELTWPIRLKIVKGVARGLQYLHSELSSYELPHGNLKSVNILLDLNYEPLLTDYAFHPLLNTTQAIHSLLACKSPEAILNRQVSPKCDVYCLGIVILEIVTGKYPSQYLGNQKGGIDIVQWVRSAISEEREIELIDPEILGKSSNSDEEIINLLRVGADCTENNFDERIDLVEAVRKIEEIQE